MRDGIIAVSAKTTPLQICHCHIISSFKTFWHKTKLRLFCPLHGHHIPDTILFWHQHMRHLLYTFIKRTYKYINVHLR